MKLSELHNKLNVPYTKEKGFGVIKIDDSEFNNIYFVVPMRPPKEIKGNLPVKLLAEAIKVIGGLPQIEQMSELDKLTNYLFVRREGVQSSRLEGTWSTIDHALSSGELADFNDVKSEHNAVRSYANLLDEIIKLAIKKREAIFTEKNICEIQRRIVENDPNSIGIPGKLRRQGEPGSVVIIGGGLRKENSIYNSTPAHEVNRCLGEVLDWFKDEEIALLGDAALGGLSLPIRLAVGHVHFEAVHPFTDGNGRTGRVLWPLQMICAGYMPLYISGYVEEHKNDYVKSLEKAQKKLNYIPMIEFICNAIIESDFENKKTKSAILKLEESWIDRTKFRANSAPRRALKLMLTNPIVSSSFFEESLKISKTASIDTINVLKKNQIIRQRRFENRKRIYAAEELIHLLSRPFGSDIDVALEKARLLLESSSSVN